MYRSWLCLPCHSAWNKGLYNMVLFFIDCILNNLLWGNGVKNGVVCGVQSGVSNQKKKHPLGVLFYPDQDTIYL